MSLQAPDSIAVREVREAYAPFVTAELLDAWLSAPSRAPGRSVSSPWPERIEIRSIDTRSIGCRVDADVVYVTSAEQMSRSAAHREPIVLHVTPDGHKISTYQVLAARPSGSGDGQNGDPADVIRAVLRGD